MESCIVNVYTDGACSNNGKKDAKAGIGVFFKENDPKNVSDRISGKQTNNTAELKAIIKAVEIIVAEGINNNSHVHIHTDSDIYTSR